MSLASGTASGQTAQRTPDSGAVPINVLYEGQHSGIERALRAVLTGHNGRSEFEQVWREVHSDRPSGVSPPIVDFQREMVIVTSMGFQAGPGSKIAIAHVSDRNSTLEVTVELRPFCGRVGFPQVTYPVVIACVPFTLSTVVFQDHLIQRRC